MTSWLDLSEWKEQPDSLSDSESSGLVKNVYFDDPNLPIEKTLIDQLELKASDMERSFPWTISGEKRDRDGDRIKVDGWDLSHARKNGVVPWAHNYSLPPLGRMIRIWRDKDARGNKRLRALKQFTPKGMNPFNDMIHDMVKGGFIKTASVGFFPLEWQKDPEAEKDEELKRRFYYPILFRRQELLESSVVPIPSYRDAFQEAKSAKIDLRPLNEWAEQTLDTGLKVPGLSREQIEQTRSVVVPEVKVFDFIDLKSKPAAEEEYSVDEVLKALEESRKKMEGLLNEKLDERFKEFKEDLLKSVEEKLTQAKETENEQEKDVSPEDIAKMVKDLLVGGEE